MKKLIEKIGNSYLKHQYKKLLKNKHQLAKDQEMIFWQIKDGLLESELAQRIDLININLNQIPTYQKPIR